MINDLQLVYMWDILLSGDTLTSDIVDILGGSGRSLLDPLRLTVMQTAAAAGGTAVTITLESSDTVDFATPTTVFTSAALATSTDATGVLLSIAVPAMQRYSRITFTKTGTFTAGQISAFITNAEEFSYPEIGRVVV